MYSCGQANIHLYTCIYLFLCTFKLNYKLFSLLNQVIFRGTGTTSQLTTLRPRCTGEGWVVVVWGGGGGGGGGILERVGIG